MSKAYRGVLKARISKLFGGGVTVAKARKLKARKNATPRDKQLANWFINMQTNKPSPVAKRKFKVWPSAYASGWGVRCTRAGGPSKFGGGKKKKKK